MKECKCKILIQIHHKCDSAATSGFEMELTLDFLEHIVISFDYLKTKPCGPQCFLYLKAKVANDFKMHINRIAVFGNFHDLFIIDLESVNLKKL